MAKKTARRRIIEKLDKVCGDIIKIRDGHRCQMCGKYVTGSDAHSSHVIPKSRGLYVRFDLLNLKLLFMHCHMNVWHKDPLFAKQWFAKKFPARIKYLNKLRDNPLIKLTEADLNDMLAEMKIKLKQLESEE
jgi:5-methylcytosine-specific restriction endonuclease McrA